MQSYLIEADQIIGSLIVKDRQIRGEQTTFVEIYKSLFRYVLWEHPFRVIKRQFGYVKVRLRGLAEHAAQ